MFSGDLAYSRGDRLDSGGRVLHLMNAALPLQSADRFSDLATGELLDDDL